MTPGRAIAGGAKNRRRRESVAAFSGGDKNGEQCSTRLLAEGNPNAWGLNACLPGSSNFIPKMHINCESAVLPVRDGLPHYRTVPAAFGGTDETVDW